MSTDADLKRIAAQERALRFARFDAASAWELGCRLRGAAEARDAALAIEVRLAGQTQFFCAMPGATPLNADWARRKRNLVELTHRSSYALGLQLAAAGQTPEGKLGLPTRDYAAHGGAFPLFVGDACVGVVAVSGLPQRDDHGLVVEALAAMLGLTVEPLPPV